MSATTTAVPDASPPAELTLFQVLNLRYPGIKPADVKLHCAVHNGEENPIDVFLAGRFDEWQRWQTRRNFDRPYVVSLIATGQKHQWLFAGLYRSGEPTKKPNGSHYYPLIEEASCKNLRGRLVLGFVKDFRQPYPDAENYCASIVVSHLREAPLSLARFPGYRKIDLSRDELRMIHDQQVAEWQSALSSVAGVYLITDTLDGRLYVGSASGKGGIWQRWSDYARNGHGDNIELKRLLKAEGTKRAQHFRYAVLEIADIHDADADVLAREAHWKNILLTRSHGLNRN